MMPSSAAQATTLTAMVLATDTIRFSSSPAADPTRWCLEPALNIADLKVSQFGGTFTVKFNGASGEIQLPGQLDGGGAGIEQFRFADGTDWSQADFFNFYVQHAGTSRDDDIIGSAGADTLQGYAGEDLLMGGPATTPTSTIPATGLMQFSRTSEAVPTRSCLVLV